MNWIEWIGYAGSVLVAASLMMSSIVRLRVLNLLGAVTFAVYGALVGALPVLIVNGFIVVVNGVYLARLAGRADEWFDLVRIRHTDNAYLRRFLEFHADDVRRYFPTFDLDALHDPCIAFILRDMKPAGLVIGVDEGEGVMRIELDYALPAYRDLRCARFFYEDRGCDLHERGVRRFVARADHKAHRAYLKHLGFRPDRERAGVWMTRSAAI
jgi:hypothetical protein